MYFVRLRRGRGTRGRAHHKIEPVRFTAEIFPDVARWSLREAIRKCAWWKNRSEEFAQWLVERAGVGLLPSARNARKIYSQWLNSQRKQLSTEDPTA